MGNFQSGAGCCSTRAGCCSSSSGYCQSRSEDLHDVPAGRDMVAALPAMPAEEGGRCASRAGCCASSGYSKSRGEDLHDAPGGQDIVAALPAMPLEEGGQRPALREKVSKASSGSEVVVSFVMPDGQTQDMALRLRPLTAGAAAGQSPTPLRSRAAGQSPTLLRSRAAGQSPTPLRSRVTSQSPTPLRSRTPTGKPSEAPVPGAPVVLSFQKPDGSRADLAFTERPLGLRYADSVPVAVASVVPRRQAEALGVQEGWSILAINGLDVSRQRVDELTQTVTAQTGHLALM